MDDDHIATYLNKLDELGYDSYDSWEMHTVKPEICWKAFIMVLEILFKQIKNGN